MLSFYRMQRTPRALPNATTDRNPEWERAHREFHLSLVSGCGSDWIVGICDKLFDASERYRHWARRAGVVRSTAEEEHRAIMEAVVKRDSAAAIALLNAHFRGPPNSSSASSQRVERYRPRRKQRLARQPNPR